MPSFPGSHCAIFALAAFALLPHGVAAQDEPGGEPPPHASACCAAVMVRGSESEPLPPARRDFRVWVEPSTRIFGWRPSYPGAVREAFAQWEEVGLPVSFVFVTDSSEANLLVYWRSRMRHQLRGRSTWWTIADIGYVRGEIEIAVGGADGQGLDHGLVRGVTLHEIGHLLGLGHTSDPWSVMSRTVAATRLSRRDIDAARALYRPIAGGN